MEGGGWEGEEEEEEMLPLVFVLPPIFK